MVTTTAVHGPVYSASNSLELQSAPRPTPALELVSRICQALEDDAVAYCHWNSNVALERTAQEDNALELLVSRRHGTRFGEIMLRLGLKQVEEMPSERFPGVMSYCGYDAASGKLVYVRIHEQLVLGQDRTKNYRVPLEEAYLASAVRQGLVCMPAPELELIVSAIRMVLKHSTWDAILTRQGRLSPSEQQELVYLQSRVDWGKIQTYLARHLPEVDISLLERALDSLRPDADFRTRVKCASQLQRQLAVYARRAPRGDVVAKVWWRVGLKLKRRLWGWTPLKTLAHGGALIALVGGDGAGKSTAVQGIGCWLGKEFGVRQVHMGKPPRAWSTLAVDAILKLERDLLGVRDMTPSKLAASRAPLRYVHLLRFVCTARDRYRVYRSVRRTVTNGGIVVCDRYPLPDLPMTDGLMLDQLIAAGMDTWVVRRLARIERAYAARIAPPDLLIVLRVDPEIAVQRRADEDAAWVRERNQEIFTADWRRIRSHVVDAGQPQEAVLAQLKAIVWAHLS